MAYKDWLRMGPYLWKRSERGVLSFIHIIQTDIDNWVVDIKLPNVPGNARGAMFKNKKGAMRYAQNFMKKFKT